jgi:hypothetical protein
VKKSGLSSSNLILLPQYLSPEIEDSLKSATAASEVAIKLTLGANLVLAFFLKVIIQQVWGMIRGI